mmetsp:Transcript_44938/g.101481  ORF Transcript_44938/g.101481 Transcript_44938/m.101481 type:complete len:537 (-) Transcript_44938:180-1790(-)
MLDRGDALHLRRVLARAVLSSTAAASMPTQQSMAMRRLVEQSDTQATREEDPAALRVLIVNRRKRRIGNVNELVRAIRHDADSPLQRRCLPLSGACDLGWHVHSIQHTLMEGMSAPEQVSGGDNMSPPVQYQGRVPLWALVHSAALVHLSQTSTPNGNLYPLSRYFPCALCYLPLLQVAMWLGGPNVVIVPHGAGSTHATYLPPCSVVIEVIPNMYPQFSFLIPTMRAGSHMLYLYETSALGNPHLTCLNSSSGVARVARGDPVMHVHAPLLLQLIHRGAALRRRCLAHYPEIEFYPHERMMQVGLAKLGAASRWASIPRLKGAQEAIQYHHAVPTIATGPGVTNAQAQTVSSLAAREAFRSCHTYMQHGARAGHECTPTMLEPRAILQAYAALRGGKLPHSCSSLCGVTEGGDIAKSTSSIAEESCGACLHKAVVTELLVEHKIPVVSKQDTRWQTRCTSRGTAAARSSAPPVTKHPRFALYRAALVSRSCPQNILTRHAELPFLWRERISELCRGTSGGISAFVSHVKRALGRG